MSQPTCLECGVQTEMRNWRSNVRCLPCARVRRVAILKTHQLVAQALRRGTLIQSDCEVCGSEDSEGHHDDYARPLDVRWLCRKHHKIHHSKFGDGANALIATTATGA